MPTRLHAVVFDAADPAALARFWATATGWAITYESPKEVDVEPPPAVGSGSRAAGLPLAFVPSDEPKVVKNRLHLDLDTRTAGEQAELVERLQRAGAVPLDIGQGAVPWVVLADPEGNELCVLDPRDEYADAGAVAAVVVDTPDPAALAPFWVAATGWVAEPQPGGHVRLTRPDGLGPCLELLRVEEPKVTKNRVHIDVAPFADDDHAAEIDRLRALGATAVDVGQGSAAWAVLADPYGNELCVLSPRD